MTFPKHLLIVLSALILSGCQTTAQGLWNDLKTLSLDSLERVDPDEADGRIVAGMCPEVMIVDELSFMSEFSDNTTRNSRLASRVFMNGVHSACAFSSGFVELDIGLSFTGKLGPKGRMRANDKPYFSYPYFVAVTDRDRNLLAKEVFSASMTFNRDEDDHTYMENLKQLIPIDNKGQANDFIVMIGFQMTKSQLDYNRNNMGMITPPPSTVEAVQSTQ